MKNMAPDLSVRGLKTTILAGLKPQQGEPMDVGMPLDRAIERGLVVLYGNAEVRMPPLESKEWSAAHNPRGLPIVDERVLHLAVQELQTLQSLLSLQKME